MTIAQDVEMERIQDQPALPKASARYSELDARIKEDPYGLAIASFNYQLDHPDGPETKYHRVVECRMMENPNWKACYVEAASALNKQKRSLFAEAFGNLNAQG